MMRLWFCATSNYDNLLRSFLALHVVSPHVLHVSFQAINGERGISTSKQRKMRELANRWRIARALADDCLDNKEVFSSGAVPRLV